MASLPVGGWAATPRFPPGQLERLRWEAVQQPEERGEDQLLWLPPGTDPRGAKARMLGAS